MGIFVAIATLSIAMVLGWLSSLAWGHWWFWPTAGLSAIAVLLLAGSGISAVIERGRPRPTLRQTGVTPEDWARGATSGPR